MSHDIKLTCRDCKKEFAFTAGEQKFFESRGFNAPSRCPDCRKRKKQQNSPHQNTQNSNDGQFYQIKCKKCGKITEVPFKPRNPEDVLCAQCFENQNK